MTRRISVALVREFAGDGASAEAKKTIQRNCCVHVLRYADGRFTLKETGRIFYKVPPASAADPPPQSLPAH